MRRVAQKFLPEYRPTMRAATSGARDGAAGAVKPALDLDDSREPPCRPLGGGHEPTTGAIHLGDQ